MSLYSVALFVHVVSLLLATAATAVAGFAALRLRSARDVPEAAQWGMLIGKVVKAFPVAALGLLATGAYMTADSWTWSAPWVVAGIAGLALIMALGAGIEGGRGRALRRELQTAGVSARARELMRDPAAWTAKVTTWTLLLAVVFVMTTKPDTGGAVAAMAIALVAGAAGAVPFWRERPDPASGGAPGAPVGAAAPPRR